jgi:predicted  nucleic acid-binding Zn-ribbon protein
MFNNKIAEYQKKMDDVKPDTTKREELQEALTKLEELTEVATKALRDQQELRKEVKDNQKKTQKELNQFPELVREKEEELKHKVTCV